MSAKAKFVADDSTGGPSNRRTERGGNGTKGLGVGAIQRSAARPMGSSAPRGPETIFAQFMLLIIIEADLGGMAGLPDDAFPAAITDFRGRIGIAKGIMASLEAR